MPVRLTRAGQALLESAAPPEQSRLGALLGSVALLVALTALDYLAGRQFNLIALYLVPVLLATWSVGRTAGIVLAVASPVLGTAADLAAGAPYSTWLIPWTMLLLWWGVFLGFVLMLSELRRSLERERELARVDPLTGVANRRHFVEAVAAELSRARRHGRPLTVAYMDLDDFKQVNDRLGHDAGDAVLLAAARTLQARLRISDVIGRMGGDEFAICLPETAAAAADMVLGQLREQVLAALRAGDRAVTVSMGAVAFASPPPTVDALLRRADEVLYAVKRAGKNRFKLETS